MMINSSLFVLPLQNIPHSKTKWSGSETGLPLPCRVWCNKTLTLLQTPAVRIWLPVAAGTWALMVTTPVTSPGCHLYFWLTSVKLGFSRSPPQVCKFARMAHKAQVNIYLCLQFIVKGIIKDTEEQPDEEVPRARARVQEHLSLWNWGVPLPTCGRLTNLEALQTPSFWVFIEASIGKRDGLNHWPLVIESTTSPRSGGRAERFPWQPNITSVT